MTVSNTPETASGPFIKKEHNSKIGKEAARAIAPTLGSKAKLITKDMTPEELGAVLAPSANQAAVRAALTRRKLTTTGPMKQRIERLYQAIVEDSNE